MVWTAEILIIYLPNQVVHLLTGLQRDPRCLIYQRRLRSRDQKRQQRIRRRIRGRSAGDYPIRAWLCVRSTCLGSLV